MQQFANISVTATVQHQSVS